MTRTFPNLAPDFKEHLQLFIAHFIRKERQPRWRSVMAMKPEKWVGASAYDCTADSTASWNTPPQDIIRKQGIERYLDSPAVIFPIGTCGGEPPFHSTLRAVLLGSVSHVECVISIVPGRVAVCYGHSGELRVCKR